MDRAKEAVQYLLDRRLLDQDEYGGNLKYVLTGKGGEFLNALKIVKKYLQEEKEDF